MKTTMCEYVLELFGLIFADLFKEGLAPKARDGSIAAFSDGRALQARLQSLHILGIVIANPQKLGRIYESESWHCKSAPQSLQINLIK